MTSLVVIAVLTVVCAAMKAVGPLAIHERPLPPRARAVIGRMPPALLVGLVLAGTVASADGLALDARSAGVAAGVAATLLRAPMVAVLAVAIAATALVRLVA